MLPENWVNSCIGDVCDFTSGTGFSERSWTAVGLPIIRIQNLNGSREFNYFNGEADPRWIVEPGELLFAWAGVPGVSFGPTLWNGPRGVLNQHIYRIIARKHIDKKWLHAALQLVTNSIEKKAHGFKSSLLHVHKKDITGHPIGVPSIEEQKAIAAVLSVWDRAIEKTIALIAAKDRLKRGLLQEPLRGKRRIRRSKGVWQKYQIGDLLREVNRHVVLQPDCLYRLVSVRRNSGGLFDREVRLGGEIGYSKLMTIETGDFLIARRQVIHGAMTVVDEPFDGAFVSDAYATLVPNDPQKLHMPFLHVLSQTPEMYYSAFRCSYGVAIEKMVFHLDWFLKEQITIPESIEEQKRIAELFATLDEEHRKLNSKLELLKQQKRALTQQLITGEIRVSDRLVKLGAKS